jgi:hypothetical protein
MKQYILIIIALFVVGCNEAIDYNENKEIEFVVPVDVSATIDTDYSKVKLELGEKQK